MNDIAADVHREITTDRSGLGFEGFGGTNQLTGTRNDTIALPDHGHHRTGGNEIHESREKGTLLVNAVMLLSQGTAWCDLLKANQFETLTLKTAKDLAHESPLHTIGLDRNERAFGHEKSLRVMPSSADNLPVGKRSLKGRL